MHPRVVCTGSSGFIGSYLVKRLRKDSEVFTLTHNSLSNISDLGHTLSKIKPSLLIHLSSYGNLASQSGELETIQANYLNLYNLLNVSKDIGIDVINFSSSSTLLDYETFYSATKGAGERLVKAFVNKYDKTFVNVLPYTVIGVGEQKEHLIPTLIRSCLYEEKMKFVKDPVHDFIGVNDFIDALMLVIENRELLKGRNVEIGSGQQFSNEEILNKVETLSGKEANYKLVGTMRKYDSNKWQADISRIKMLGFSQKESIQEVIKEMINYELGI